jgi:PKD repeat protein
LQILENNTLSSSDPISPYYINTTMIAYDTDAAGDQNVFITRSAGWCGDMMGTNAVNSTYSTPPGTTGYSHAYAHYNKGLFIYNGLDIDDIDSDSDPTANTGEGHLAKIWLLELEQPWDNVTGTTVCGLPCEAPIPPPTPVCVTPTAEFSATPTTGLAPLGVQFTDKSTGNVTSWLWDFGDGKTSTAHNPTNTYIKEGKYTVELTVSGPCGEDTETKVKYISVLASTLVEAASLSCSGFYITPQQVQSGQEVTISITVANTGGATGSYNAVLYINGVVEDSQSVSVAGGASKNVIFTVTKKKAGVYDVSICGQNGQFEVVGGGGWFAGGLGTGGIIAIVVVVIVLIVAVIFILRGTARPE